MRVNTNVIRLSEIRKRRGHADASAGAGKGRGTPSGQAAPAGQLSENHCIVLSSRRTWMSAPPVNAPSFLVSPSARQLTVDKSKRSLSAYARATISSCSIPVISGLSVDLPEMSTAILPDAPELAGGYFTAMDREQLLAWIEAGLKAKNLKADRAAKLAGHPDMIRNLRRGVSIPKIGALRALARIIGDPPPGLFETQERHPPTLEELRAERDEFRRKADELDLVITILERRAG
jgi:transcriptional regulator with XRE-family HTH domain